MTDAIKILTPGWLTTVQDQGRLDFLHMGVPISGYLDTFSAAMANLLVGNPVNTGLLEITVMGPVFTVLKEMDMAVAGAIMDIQINGSFFPQWETIHLNPGDKVVLGQAQKGCRAYLAFGGGVDVPRIMGSVSTYFAGKIGGFCGRALKKDDVLGIRHKAVLDKPRCLPHEYRSDFTALKIIRAIPGPQVDFFPSNSLFGSSYEVTEKADRMGYRLSGPAVPFQKGRPKSIISEPVLPGSIQIPPDQQPIILLNEQTVGGYAKIATIISADLPVVAQAMPGDAIMFEKVDLSAAHTIFLKEKEKIHTIENLFRE
ncbi:5-oxoprolinase subunit C family protein [Desulfobacula sp.]